LPYAVNTALAAAPTRKLTLSPGDTYDGSGINIVNFLRLWKMPFTNRQSVCNPHLFLCMLWFVSSPLFSDKRNRVGEYHLRQKPSHPRRGFLDHFAHWFVYDGQFPQIPW